MKHLTPTLYLIVSMLGSGTLLAQNTFNDAFQAYNNGDYETTVRIFTPLAEQGYASAQLNLGAMYANGEGIIQNNILAHMWWNIAASTGNEGARTNRDSIASNMSSTDISRAQQLAAECVSKDYKDC